LFHHQRTFLLRFLHLRFLIAVGLPETTMQDLRRGVVHLLPAVEAATLAQGAHGVGEGVMDIMEQHPEMGRNLEKKTNTFFLKVKNKQNNSMKKVFCVYKHL